FFEIPMSQYWPFSGLTRYSALRERLIVSLDLGGRREALKMVDQLGRLVGMFKIGKQLFVSGGPDFVREVRRRGAEVFLDLKFHDSRRALTRTALEATRLGVRMFDVQLNGHADSIAHVRADINRLCRNEGLRKPHIVAVAMLMEVSRPRIENDRDDVSPPGLDGVVKLARHAAIAGFDGVFTSSQGAPRIRGICGRRFIIVTPVPSVNDGAGEFVDGASATHGGADFLVVGSPIWKSNEPMRAVRDIVDQIDRGLRTAPPDQAPILVPRHQ
ncbi:MAG TPA: orotidine 5'-phosphate decarboxylase / HUMPS family protein, partial [Candidatus Binataceae bacterium]|nr:orotidine 5'-phosphate decarboxylase / HUMPS family protein [Candidatus Binataceae bacterium]